MPVTERNEMVEAHLGLVHSVARGYRGRGVAYEDLVQEGVLGLLQAAERFDEGRELQFSTYAVWWVRRAMVDAVAGARPIRIPPEAGRRLAAVRRVEADLRRQGPVTNEAIADRTGLGVGSVRRLRSAARVAASLDEQVGEEGAPLVDLVADPDAVDPWRAIEVLETRKDVGAMLRLLPPRHRQILVRRYGLLGAAAQSHAQIGAWLGIGETRSRQLEHEALHRLRELGGGAFHAA
jgi:RNA polymerase primary sigma factor